ncbi:ferric/cupric reductase transmembrane component B [Colletotrichum spaethianum]|uniref:Ferric/cupric reductase transmembrane component B n=1 Tax=Colletotrichum spaethianum TaxID=700344 RepID=A0AA37PCY9_9PEZI|nr:ferric/cupric reductase transmembrane component B [Colletotrichum spaethianum]GKT50003.1 ferric/cupric reductase transmembrane component B [Colletotrichum spaethianum]
MPPRYVFLPVFAATDSLAMGSDGRAGHGLVGYGIKMHDPPCAFACRDAISTATLSYSTVGSDEMGGMSGMSGMVMTDGECYATDDAFLETLTWCVAARCEGIPEWRLEKYWKNNVAGAAAVQPDPKVTYQQALAKVIGTPAAVYAATGPLNETSMVSHDLWYAAYNTDVIFEGQESMQAKYGLIILLSGVVIPFFFSLLRFVPFPSMWCSRFNAWIIDPPLFGSHHDTPVFFGLVVMPKRGQALFIFYFIVINTVLSAVNYEYADHSMWFPNNRWRWMCMLVSNRLGLLSFANLPLMFLYAGRNNLLLWATDWSHSTFLLLHRWIAAIATLQAILHSIIYLDVYVKNGTHSSESKEPYWYWGVVATVGLAVLFPTSAIPNRRKAYEHFLAWHVVIAIMVVAGCCWHIVFAFSHKWGYEVWIFVCMAGGVSTVSLESHGVKTAFITVIDEEYCRVTIPGVFASGVAYAYFPALTWRVWENHPFSVASAILPSKRQHVEHATKSSDDVEKRLTAVTPADCTSLPDERHSSTSQSAREPPQLGITFYIRTQSGMTSLLRHRDSVPVLLEVGYPSHSPLSELPHNSPALIALAGGVGITAILPHLRSHPGRVKLYRGCRNRALVDDVENTGVLSGIEIELFIGKRMAVREVLKTSLSEARGRSACWFLGPAV